MEHGQSSMTQQPWPVGQCRRAYSTPRLIVYGDVVTLTRNVACGGNDGPAGQFLS